MDDLKILFKEIDTLKNHLKALKPLKSEDEARLWKKFRLEWNYNSNHIEGNTLTYGQTELLVIFDKAEGDHELRELEEMKAHDVAIQLVKEYASDKTRKLSESDIRQWNKTILVRPFWSDALTSDGQPTRKLITPGDYKKEPNSVRLSNGEIFQYTSPEEVPIQMKELMEWYEQEKPNLHPLHLAALLHYKFVRIHPFDDSNGRTSRLLMNYELLRNDFPPVIIKSSDKKGYLFALNKADVGDENAFIKYVGDQLKWSLELSIKSAKGESIEESDDVYKEIDLLKKELNYQMKGEVFKTLTSFKDTIQNSISPLFIAVFQGNSSIDNFFLTNQLSIQIDSSSTIVKDKDDIVGILKKGIDSYNAQFSTGEQFSNYPHTWSIQFYHADLKTVPDFNTYFNKKMAIKFKPLQWEIFYEEFHLKRMKYSEVLDKEEIEQIVNRIMKDLLNYVKSPTSKN